MGGPGDHVRRCPRGARAGAAGATAETRAALAAFLPPEASTTNPVDMLAGATAEHYAAAVDLVLADPAIDAVVVIFLPPLGRAPTTWRVRCGGPASGQAAPDRLHGPPATTARLRPRLSCYDMPEAAAIALARAVRYAAWRARPNAPDARPAEIDLAAARGLISAAVSTGDGWLEPSVVQRLCGYYGITVVGQRVVDSPAAAGAAAAELGGAVVIKAIAPGLVHKTEAGAVRLGVTGAASAAAAAAAIADSVRADRQAADRFSGSAAG